MRIILFNRDLQDWFEPDAASTFTVFIEVEDFKNPEVGLIAPDRCTYDLKPYIDELTVALIKAKQGLDNPECLRELKTESILNKLSAEEISTLRSYFKGN